MKEMLEKGVIQHSKSPYESLRGLQKTERSHGERISDPEDRADLRCVKRSGVVLFDGSSEWILAGAGGTGA